jgi:nicotinamide riboside transporter PnuC
MFWIGLVLTTWGIILNAKKHMACWPIWITSDVFWILGCFFMNPIPIPLVLMNVVFLGANCYAWKQWRLDAGETSKFDVETTVFGD